MKATKKILVELKELNRRLWDHFTSDKVTFVATSDLLSGKQGSNSADLMTAMLECWCSDPVHGDRLAYSKIAMGLLDRFSKHTIETPRGRGSKKRARDTLSSSSSEPDSPERLQSRNQDVRQSGSGSADRHSYRQASNLRSAYNSWPGDQRRARSYSYGGGGRGGGRGSGPYGGGPFGGKRRY